MKNSALIFVVVCSALCVPAWAAKQRPPSEVIADIKYLVRGGAQGVKIDFVVPVHYVSHNPQRFGSEITVDLRFNRTEVPDTSELPLLQTLTAPPSDDIPLKEVTYLTQDGKPRIVVSFTRKVRFNVSQIMGINSLVLFVLSEEQEVGEGVTIEELNIKPKAEVAKEDSLEDIKARKIFDSGRAALTKGDNKQAVQIFTALISQLGHRYLQESLELLGVARERNGQAAQAKSVYKQYIELYPKGEGTDRVKQRLADLISNQLTPRAKLKEADKDGRLKNAQDSQFSASFSQYMNYQESHDENGRSVDMALLSNQLSSAWRLRKEDYDIRTQMFVAYDEDTIDGQTDGVAVSTLYAKVRNTRKKYDLTLGRQSGATAGVLGRFDGLLAGYEFTGNQRINAVWGYPVDIQNKQDVQTNKPFYGVSVELNGLWKNWDLVPYMIQQEVDGISDRSAIGSELRYARENADAFALVDYDTLFDEVNILHFRGKYDLRKQTSLKLTVDERRNPLLETSNALLQLSEDATISDLLGQPGIDESRLQDVAADRTGAASFVSLGVSHEYNKRYQLNAEINFSHLESRYLDTAAPLTDRELLDASTIEDVEDQTDYVVQLIANNWLDKNVTAMFYLDVKTADSYDEFILSMEYRQPLTSRLRFNGRLKYRDREDDAGVGIRRIIPAANLDWRWSQDMRIFFEFEMEDWSYSGDTLNRDFKLYQIFTGYNWDF